MPSWYDIHTFVLEGKQDEPGQLIAAQSINKLITAEVEGGIDTSRIVIGGFSQGGALTLLTGLTSERKLAGLTVLGGRLPFKEKIGTMLSQHATNTPVFWGHGRDDPRITFRYASDCIEDLKNAGLKLAPEGNLTFKSYPNLQHSTNPQEIADWQAWLKGVLPQTQ